MKNANKKRLSKGWLTGLVLGLVSSAVVVYATVVPIPNTFVGGQRISAAEMNENFDAIASCPGDMWPVGTFCIDEFEASVWNVATGGTVGVNERTSAACNANGNNCSATDSAGTPSPFAIFAQSRKGVLPAVNFTWFQAQQACANVGKRLPTNAEWQMAAAGTPDSAAFCNTTDGVPTNTGANLACVSNWGVADMTGNVWEWVADWIQGTQGVNPTGSAVHNGTYGTDVVIEINEALSQSGVGVTTHFPSALARGGDFNDNTAAGIFAIDASNAPSRNSINRGFRCAR